MANLKSNSSDLTNIVCTVSPQMPLLFSDAPLHSTYAPSVGEGVGVNKDITTIGLVSKQTGLFGMYIHRTKKSLNSDMIGLGGLQAGTYVSLLII